MLLVYHNQTEILKFNIFLQQCHCPDNDIHFSFLYSLKELCPLFAGQSSRYQDSVYPAALQVSFDAQEMLGRQNLRRRHNGRLRFVGNRKQGRI